MPLCLICAVARRRQAVWVDRRGGQPIPLAAAAVRGPLGGLRPHPGRAGALARGERPAGETPRRVRRSAGGSRHRHDRGLSGGCGSRRHGVVCHRRRAARVRAPRDRGCWPLHGGGDGCARAGRLRQPPCPTIDRAPRSGSGRRCRPRRGRAHGGWRAAYPKVAANSSTVRVCDMCLPDRRSTITPKQWRLRRARRK